MPADPIDPLLFRHPVSAASHLLFALWAGYATALFTRLAPRGPARRGAVTFGASMTLLYGISGLYHAIPADRPRLVEHFGLLDLSAIHLLIAGTCTAMAAALRPRAGRRLNTAAWSLALAGVAAKWLLPLPSYPVTVGLYVASGAVGLAALPALARVPGRGGIAWLAGGALVYAAGAACEVLRWPVVWPGVIGPHEILHICDIGATLFHVVFVTRSVRGGIRGPA